MSLDAKTIRWLAEHAPEGLRGKRILITGASSGIGLKTTEILAFLGAEVIMACRDLQKAEKVRADLLREYPDAVLSLRYLDLADLDSVKAFAEMLRNDSVDIDVFVNNAGVFRCPGETVQGVQLVPGVNYLGVYCLSEMLLPWLAEAGHEVVWVNTVSMIHRFAPRSSAVLFRNAGGSFRQYAASKLALARYTLHLARCRESSSLRICMIHPGVSITPIALRAYGKGIYRLAVKLGFLFNPPERGALSLILALSGSSPPGTLTGPALFFGARGWPEAGRAAARAYEGIPELLEITRQELERIHFAFPPATDHTVSGGHL